MLSAQDAIAQTQLFDYQSVVDKYLEEINELILQECQKGKTYLRKEFWRKGIGSEHSYIIHMVKDVLKSKGYRVGIGRDNWGNPVSLTIYWDKTEQQSWKEAVRNFFKKWFG